MKKFIRWVLLPLCGLVLIYLVGGTFAFYALKNPAVEKSQLIADSTFGAPQDLRRLMTGSCDQFRDEFEITHIKTSDPLLIWACVGKIHARDRGWQMDYFRRVAWGRLAEILGSRLLIQDLMLRILDLESLARRLYLGMEPTMKAKLQAYAYGVNSGFLEHAQESYEFREFGYKPELWQPHHSVMLLMLQSFSQTRRTFERDLLEQRWIARYGMDAAKALADESASPWFSPILNTNEAKKLLNAQANLRNNGSADAKGSFGQNQFSNIQSWADLGKNLFGKNSGSNSWILSPSISVGNAAWMVNDPHVDMLHPPFWHWVHVEGPEFNLMAASLAGVPVFPAGTNGKVAWGLTNSFFDVSDVFEVPEKQLKLKKFRPWVWMKLGFFRVPFFFRTFARTEKEGYPILPLDNPPSAEGTLKVLRWAGYHMESADAEAIFSIPEETSAPKMREHFARARVASWNFVMADTKGDIAYQVTGRLPKHDRSIVGVTKVDQVPAPEWLSSEEIPHAINPAKQYLATANQRHFPDAFSVWPGRAHYPAFRGFRIHEKIDERLRSKAKFDLAENLKVICDSQMVDARFLVPRLLALIPENEGWSQSELAHLKELRNWPQTDYRADEECRACGTYQRWIDLMMQESGLDERAVYRALTEIKLPGWDQAMLVRVFKKAVAEIGPVKPWRELHLHSFGHVSGDDRFVHPPGVPTIGSEHSVSPGSGYFDGKVYRHIDGPSQRLLIEMTSPPKVYLNLVGTNLDHEKRDLLDPKSPYQVFRRCEAPLMHYPVDWTAEKTSALKLKLR